MIKTDGCETCHQLGNRYTRTIPAMFSSLDPAQAWMRRVQSGQAGGLMIERRSRDSALSGPPELWGDWTTRIKKGELPTEAPPRPQGIERNVVITQWDWADPKAYLHDEISTDKRNPTVNANGLIYGSPEESRDYLPVLDPVHDTHQPGESSISRSGYARSAEAVAALARSGATRPSGTATPRFTIPCSTSADGCGSPLASAAETTPPFARRGRAFPRQSLLPPKFRPPAGDVRSEDQANLDDRHLLRHAPPDVCRGCQRHAVDQQRRWRRGCGLAQRQDVG